MIASSAAILAIALQQLNIQEYLQSTLVWIQNLGPVGAIAFMAIYILATVLLIPASLLTLGGGVLFGVFRGAIFVFIAATIGATIAFLIGRYLSRNWVAKRIEGNAQFQAIDRAVGQEGFKIVLLTRLSPVFPFVLLNYAFGITSVSLRDYALGFVGMIPGTVSYTYLGSAFGNLTALFKPTIAPKAPSKLPFSQLD
jgi:uncharacterized membrane protein YdjX (TVP38/TMEM64 family)